MSAILGRLGFRLWVTAVLVFLPAPIVVVIASSFSRSGYLRFPPQGLSLRWYAAFLTDEVWLRALAVSLSIAVGVALATTCFAILAALATTRRRFRGRSAFELLMLSPLLFPHAAIGVSLLSLLATLGWIGRYPGILLAHAILCVPFAYRPLAAAMRKLDLSLEEAAMSLGAPPAYVFRTVTLPVLRPAIVTALLFSFVISFDEVTVTIFLVGPSAATLPTRIFAHIQESASPVVAAVASVLVLLTVLLVVVLQRFVGLDFYVGAERSR